MPEWAIYAIAIWLGVHWAYPAVMAAKAAIERGSLTLYWKVNLLPLALIGVLLDFAFNYTFGWMFLKVPRPILFSSTVQHWYRNGDGWRLRLARFYGRNLNVFDDSHIRS